MGKRLADVIACIHGILIVVVLSGVPVMCIWPSWAWVEAVIITGVLLSWPIFGECPLKSLEVAARRRWHYEGIYTDPCIIHYARQLFGIEIPHRVITLAALSMLAAAVWMTIFPRGPD